MANEYIIQRKKTERAFQYSVELNLKKDLKSAVFYNARLIYSWIKKKYSKVYSLPSKIPSAFSKKTLDILYKANEHFCCRIEHSDGKFQGREWLTEVEVIARDEKALLGIKVSYTTPEGADYNRNIFSVPTFIWEILNKNGFSDVRELKQSVFEADSEEKLNELYDLLVDKNRIFPVVVITDLKNDEDSTSPIISPEDLLYRAGIIAHVVHIPCELCFSWKNKVGYMWDVYNGAVRTYYENLNFDDDNFYEHPLFTAQRIAACEYVSDNGEDLIGATAFMELLIEKLRNRNTRLRIDWRGRGHKFLETALREADSEQLKFHNDKMNSLEKTWEELCKEERERFEKEKNNLEDELLDAYEKSEQLKKDFERARGQIYSLECRIESLKQKLLDAGNAEEIIPAECTYEYIPQWVKEYFPTTLYLSPRAKRSLKQACYKDVRLVYRALELLGTEYWQMKTGLLDKAAFEEKCHELDNVKVNALTITDSRAGERDDVYFIEYRGKRRKLELHLKKGDDREEKNCLRIYYFWDDENSVVVIGSLPGHLETRNT